VYSAGITPVRTLETTYIYSFV